MRSWLFLGIACFAPLYAQTPVVADGGVLNAASAARGQAVSPGSLVSIFGSELAASLSQADSIPLATSLGGVSVTVNNVSAPLLFVSPGQINAQVPFNAMGGGSASGNASVVVRRGSASSTTQVRVEAVSPGIFTTQFGVGQAISINPNGSLTAAAGAIPGLSTEPTTAGGVIIILCTGLGAVDPPIQAGEAPGATLRQTVDRPVVMIGGVEAAVLFSGLSPQFPGVYQLNVQVASGTPTGNAVPLQLRQGGITTSDQVTIAVR
jgi:uncharacterized protein (TIGR03437 family)